MSIEVIRGYSSLAVDYSVIREFGGTALFSRMIDIISECGHEVYVSKAFKMLHYCVLHQGDDKNTAAAGAMKDFCTILLASRKLHSVQATETADFISKISTVDNVCILTTEHSIFTKRLLEKKPSFSCDIAVIFANGIDCYHGSDDFYSNMPVTVISPLAGINKYLEASVYCNVGDSVDSGSGKKITLVKRVSAGAEGMVFTTDNPRIVAKVYHKGVITPLRWNKLTKMVSMGIKSIGICWPQDLLFYRGIPVGYTMILGKGKTLGNVFDGPDAITDNFPGWKRVDIVNTLIDLLEKYLYLHMHDIIAGDIQMKNVLLYSSSSLYLIDMDSVQVGNLPCPVGTEEFTDPALWGKNFSVFLRRLEDEDYSIAMLVFSILFCGLHPYATRNGAETLREEILERNFPYDLQNVNEEHIPRGGYNHIWKYLPENIRHMLYDVFKNGRKFETTEWLEAVYDYKEALTSRKYEDEEAYKVFPKMDYHKTPESSGTPAPGDLRNAAYRSRFADVMEEDGLGKPNVFSGSISGAARASASSNPPYSPFAKKPSERPNSAFVPRAEGNTQGQSPFVPSGDQKNEEDNGIFKKFKKGLFG